MKKKMTFILMIMSLLMSPMLSHAAAVSAEEKAIVLNKLTILQGNGVDFNLGGKLKRSEAVTFIVRIMGKEAYVKANLDKYSTTSFNDVKAQAWYTPYIAYCVEQHILNGFPDGGFHPEESISEKAFLKIVLGSLGYVDEKDFVWDTIYESSLNLGLVVDVKYKTQLTDNTNYLRSDVVNVLYGTLTNSVKGLKKRIIDLLIEANIVPRSTAVELGFVKEIVQTKIDSVQVANDVTLKILLSKPVLSLVDSNITIYETNNKANQLKASVTSQVYGDLVVNTAKQIPDKAYTIEITNKVEGSDTAAVAISTFVGYKTLEIKSNYFKISKVVPMSKNKINVYFTQPINSGAALPVYYDLYKNDVLFVKGSLNNMTVKALSEQNNVMSLYLKNATIAEDVVYSIKLSGDVVSAYGVQLNDGLGDSIAFASNKQENDALQIVKITTIDAKNIRLEFNKELDLATAQQSNNFNISSKTGIANPVSSINVPRDGKGRTVLLTTAGTFDRNLDYQVIINNVSDLFNLSIAQEMNYAFLGKPSLELKDLNLQFVKAIDKTTLQLYFDKNVDPVSASNVSYYMITGVTDPNFVAFPTKVMINSQEPMLVKLYLPPVRELSNTSEYKLRVLRQVLDEQGNMSSVDTTSPKFNGSTEVNVKPTILEAMIIGKDTVKIKSSKELLLSGSNVLLSNYSLELKEGKNTFIFKTPSSITPFDETTLLLHFDDLDVTKGYTFKFNTLTDYTGVNVRGIADGSTSILLKKGDTP